MIAFYYGSPATRAPLLPQDLFTSVRNFVFVGLAPFLGGAILTFVFVKSIIDFTGIPDGESGDSWVGHRS